MNQKQQVNKVNQRREKETYFKVVVDKYEFLFFKPQVLLLHKISYTRQCLYKKKKFN